MTFYNVNVHQLLEDHHFFAVLRLSRFRLFSVFLIWFINNQTTIVTVTTQWIILIFTRLVFYVNTARKDIRFYPEFVGCKYTLFTILFRYFFRLISIETHSVYGRNQIKNYDYKIEPNILHTTRRKPDRLGWGWVV